MKVERYYSHILKPFGQLSKPVKIVNEKHLRWIRSLPCIISGNSSGMTVSVVAHHVQKKSQIRNDYMTIPLRADLHTEFHLDEVFYEEKQMVDFKDALIAKLVERLVQLEQGFMDRG